MWSARKSCTNSDSHLAENLSRDPPENLDPTHPPPSSPAIAITRRTPSDTCSSASFGIPLTTRVRLASDNNLTRKPDSSSGTEVTSSSASSGTLQDIKCDILANWLHTKQEERIWTGDAAGEGVFVKKSKGNYACAPRDVVLDGSNLHQSICQMNVRVCVVVFSNP